MRKNGWAVFLAATVLGACQGDPGRDVGRIANDDAVLRQATGAANEVIRNATDCEAARAALPEANQKLDEAEKNIRTPAGRATIGSIRAQVNTIIQNCP
jgi:hypothetical protein